jgi:hypothetical protein
MINENNYRGLSSSELKRFKKVQLDSIPIWKCTGSTDFIYEIRADQICSIAKISEYLWVHLWRPSCHGPECHNVDYYFQMANEFEPFGLNLFMVADQYDIFFFHKLQPTMDHDCFFVIDDSTYGHKIPEARRMFISQLINQNANDTTYRYNDFLFKNGALIFAGSDISEIELKHFSN